MQSSIELPPIQNHLNQQSIPPFHSPRPRELLPSMLAHSPPGRSSTLPPLQRKESTKRDKPARPRKSSITQNSRKPKHERTKSKDHTRRMSIEGRKAFSAEPPGAAAAAAMGKRWEDLIEAATSATEADSDRDLTPVGSSFPSRIAICLDSSCPDPPVSPFNQARLPPTFFVSITYPILQSLTSGKSPYASPLTFLVWTSPVPFRRNLNRILPLHPILGS